ncbi:MAG: thiol:disulfide interchange protein DsbA/DsbL [Gammaproteobacteria bacterium]|nr:thiol:disulfide interchange protein DsbA/DsbL [Gammaproteobacteria bacterium]
MKKKNKQSSADIARYVILGTLGLILGAVVVYSLLYIFGVTDDTERPPYLTLSGNDLQTDPIEVIEFFSYDCPHCRRLESFVDDWVENLPDGVTFRRVHVAFSGRTKVLATIHWMLQERGILDQNHDRIFKTAGEGKLYIFETLETMAEYFDGYGITAEQFKALFNSQTLARRVEQNQTLTDRYRVTSVPQILVANKYKVFASKNSEKILEVVDELITDILSGELPETEATVEETKN